MRSHQWFRVSLLALALALVAGACTGNRSVSGRGGTGNTESSGSADQSGAGSGTGEALSPTAASSIGATSPKAVPGGPGTISRPGDSGQTTSAGFTYKPANLFTPDQDRVGVTSNQITLCVHAAMVAGPAFGNTEDDLQTYWKWLNDRGGIYGRKVNMVFTDDAYTPQGGVQAAQQCQQAGAFFMMAGVGFDTVPAVRQWAEQNKMLYISSFATETGLYDLKYTFQPAVSVEHFGRVAGNYTAAKYPGKFGIVWRNSPNWQGGRDNFAAAVREHGSKVVADIPVQQNQGEYTSVVLNLKNSGAQTVLAWFNVLEFTQLEKQAAAQGYYPRWVVPAFQLVTDVLGEDVDGSKGPPIVGLLPSTEYHQGDRSSPWSDEIATMEAAYAKYDPDKETINDVDWQTWLAFKEMTRFLLDCGKDCTRNKLAGMLLSGYKLKLHPLCAVDFARGRGKLGSFELNVMEGTKRDGKSGWKQVASCAETF